MNVFEPLRIVDTHLHLWSAEEITRRWVPPPLLRRDFLPEAHGRLLRRAGVERAVLVEAGENSLALHGLAARLASTGIQTRVVASLDLRSRSAASRIAAAHAESTVRALRMNLEGATDLDFLDRPSTVSLLGLVSQAGLRWEFLVTSEQLPAVRRVLERCPELVAAIEHCGKPRLDDPSSLRRWRDEMSALATGSRARCKLSFGFRADAIDEYEAGVARWPAGLAPLARWIVESFGPQRTMWGSDWPLSRLLGSYRDALTFWLQAFGPLSTADRAWIFSATAHEFYGLDIG